MKRTGIKSLISILVILGLAFSVNAEQAVKVSDVPSGVKLLNQDQMGLTIQLEIGSIDFLPVETKEGAFVYPRIDGLSRSFEIGKPNLPVAGKIIAIPSGAKLSAEVIDFEVEEISLKDFGITDRILPAQPSMSKSVDPADMPFEMDYATYNTAGYFSIPPVQTEILGTMRDLRLAQVSISPIEYDPVANKLRVYKNMTVQVSFINPDWDKTESLRTQHYSKVFEPIYNNVLNYTAFASQAKNDSFDLVKYPVKFLIISHRMFEAQLQPLIEWKTKKGFNVVVAYTDEIGTTNTAIAGYIEGLYNAGTPEDPAPSFVPLVGDSPQIPPFSGTAGSHVTDLYFCEFTGDLLPEIYYGRLSAQNTGQLQPQIDKTLEYEQYLMPDPSYLDEVTLVAGVDGTYAITHGNGQINYGTNYYFDAAHGITPNVWLYPASAGSVDAAIIDTINNGVSFHNYSAHCGHSGQSDPSFTTSDVPGLTNYNKYFVGVGNCCLANTFAESTPCFGEALLQIAGKGAVGYLAATNSTYWDEDYWWGCGYGSVVGAGPTYEQTTLGAYDGMFHDKPNEASFSRHYVTNDAIIFAGNLGVSASSTSRKAYYWEAYCLMGDPSLMTYLGVPLENTVSHDATVLLIPTSYTVSADPGSYVCISYEGVIHGVGFVDETGSVDIDLVPFDIPGTADIVITAQNRIPYIETIQIISPDGPFVIHDDHTADDILGNNDGLVNCGESISLDVTLMNVGPDPAYSVIAVLSTGDEYITITDDTEAYGTIPGDFGSSEIIDAFAFDVSENMPNEHTIEFNLAITGSDVKDTTWNMSFSIDGFCYPDLTVDPYSFTDSISSDQSTIDTITVTNDGHAPLEIEFTSYDSWLSFAAGIQTVPPHDNLDFEVTVSSVNMPYNDSYGSIDFTSNDPLNTGGTFMFHLHVFAPDISVSDMEISDTVMVNELDSKQFTINNNGPGMLEYNITRLMFNGKGTTPTAKETAQDPLGYRLADAEKSNTGEQEPYYAAQDKGSGGPDLWGYNWDDSDEPDGPTYEWVDISGVGTAIDSIGDDDTTGAIPIGFSFPFYENYYSELYIGSNGIITFGTPSKVRTNTTLPYSLVPNNMIALWWDDLDPRMGGQIYYYHDAANDRFIVSFDGTPNYSSTTGTGSLWFQAILYTNGKIKLQYGVMDTGEDYYGYTSATIGIENSTGTDGLEVVYNAEYMHENLAILFVAANWLSVEPGSGWIDPYSSDMITANFDAAELADGDYNGQLSITSNDPDTPNLDITVTMTVTSEPMAPNPPSLVFPENEAIDVSQPLTIDWSDVSNADNYQLMIDTSAIFTTAKMDSSMTESQCEVDGLDQDMMYYWKVRAQNEIGWSGWSEVRNFTTEITWICGDFDGNMALNILDITSFISYLYQEGDPPVFMEAVDVDGNGSVNVLDVTALIAYLYQQGDELNCP